MTTIAAPPRRARARTRTTATHAPTGARAEARGSAKRATKGAIRTATRPLALGRVGGVLAVVTVLVLVTAVVFHVVLAQNQMELDRIHAQIAKEQRTYEQRRLTASVLDSPQRVIQEAERLGLVAPQQPAQYLWVPDAPMPKTGDRSTADTLADWSKTKASLGAHEP